MIPYIFSNFPVSLCIPPSLSLSVTLYFLSTNNTCIHVSHFLLHITCVLLSATLEFPYPLSLFTLLLSMVLQVIYSHLKIWIWDPQQNRTWDICLSKSMLLYFIEYVQVPLIYLQIWSFHYSFFLTDVQNTIVYRHHIFIIHKSLGEHLSCLHFQTIVNRALMNMDEQLCIKKKVESFSKCQTVI